MVIIVDQSLVVLWELRGYRDEFLKVIPRIDFRTVNGPDVVLQLVNIG